MLKLIFEQMQHIPIAVLYFKIAFDLLFIFEIPNPLFRFAFVWLEFFSFLIPA